MVVTSISSLLRYHVSPSGYEMYMLWDFGSLSALVLHIPTSMDFLLDQVYFERVL